MSRRFARTAAALVATALLSLLSLGASDASASRFLQHGIFDDASIHYGDPEKVFPMLKQLNTKLIRINLIWGGKNGVATRRPARPTNPNDSAYDWSSYDRTVNYAAQYGMNVVFSIIGTPPWANKAAGVNVAPSRMLDLQRFATAAARRYSGTWEAPDGRTLPPVRYWIAWNEPNNPVFLKPQFRKTRGGWAMKGAADYARICNAIVKGIRITSVGAQKVACGVTGPRGNNNPNSIRPSTSPLAFLRAMRRAGAKGFDAYAHHPYYGHRSETPTTPPPNGSRGQAPTAITLGNFHLLVREVTRLYGNKRIWITEYGYQTTPQDRIFGVTYRQQAQYLTQAYGIARRHPRVDMFLWFLLKDELRSWGWQSGLVTYGGARKPSYAAFRKLAR